MSDPLKYKDPTEIGDWLIKNRAGVKHWLITMAHQAVERIMRGEGAAAHQIIDLMCAVAEHIREHAPALMR